MRFDAWQNRPIQYPFGTNDEVGGRTSNAPAASSARRAARMPPHEGKDSAMSTNHRGVQSIGFVILLMGIISAVAGAALFFGAPFAEGVIEDGPAIARMFGIIIAVMGVFQLIAGIIGMRAAKRDNLLKPFTYLCAFIIVVCLAEIGMSFTSGEEMGPVWPYLIYAAVCFSGVMFAGRALKENGAA